MKVNDVPNTSHTLLVFGIIFAGLGFLFSNTSIGGYEEKQTVVVNFPDPLAIIINGQIVPVGHIIGINYYVDKNFTINQLSFGSVVQIKEVRLYATPFGYRWTSDGDWELFSPDGRRLNATADIGLYSDTYHELASVTVKIGEEEIVNLKEFEVWQSELLPILNISCVSSSPFEIDVLYGVVTLYGRIAPYIKIAGIGLILVALLSYLIKYGDNDE
jgi:hypothetical protein